MFNFAQPVPGEVTFSWSADSAITDRAAAPNGFQGGSWTCSLDPNPPAEPVVISEFLASNRAGLRDEDGDSSDWLELHNEGETTVGLAGWSLSDEPGRPGKWIFPDVSLEAGGYLVVFASGKDRREPGGQLHTNFSLSSEGEFLVPGSFDCRTIALS